MGTTSTSLHPLLPPRRSLQVGSCARDRQDRDLGGHLSPRPPWQLLHGPDSDDLLRSCVRYRPSVGNWLALVAFTSHCPRSCRTTTRALLAACRRSPCETLLDESACSDCCIHEQCSPLH